MISVAVTKRLVKVCGMRDPENISAIASLAPDYLGFIFAPHSKRFVGALSPAAIRENVPSGIRSVAVFVDESLERILETVDAFRFDAVQLHGDERSDFISALKARRPSLEVWKAVSMSDKGSLTLSSEYYSTIDLFVFDNGSGGTGSSFDWNILEMYKGPIPYLIAGGIGAEEIEKLKARALWSSPLFRGIDCNSKVETEPGVKDPALVRRVIEEVRT